MYLDISDESRTFLLWIELALLNYNYEKPTPIPFFTIIFAGIFWKVNERNMFHWSVHAFAIYVYLSICDELSLVNPI